MNKRIDIVKQYLAAYAAKDIDAISALISSDVKLQDWNIQGSGAEFFLAETAKNFDQAHDIRIEILRLLESDSAIAAQLHIKLDGGAVALHVVDVICFDGENRISEVRAYKG
jgi:hypothetical protein